MYRLITITQVFLIAFLLAAPAGAVCLSGNQMEDFAAFSLRWLDDDCNTPYWCDGMDLDQSHDVDLIDFAWAFGPVEPLTLVDNGICKVSIHNKASGTPSEVELYAAGQLRAAFQLACGVTPQINPSTPAEIEIHLGVANQFNLGVEDTNEQAYTVRRTFDNNIQLVGNCTSAVMWAVDDFCKEVLHVSWPISTDVMVREGGLQSTVTVERLCKVEAPDLPVRGWIIGEGTDGYHYDDTIGRWMAHNRQNTIHNNTYRMEQGGAYTKALSRGITVDTTWHDLEWLIPETLYDEHPEYFPLINGVRVKASINAQRCLSNPDVRAIILDKIEQGFAEFPDIEVFGVGQNDGAGGWCQCGDYNCGARDGAQAGTGQYSNRLIYFINDLANTIGPNHPGKYIGTFAYDETLQGPDFDVADNVSITFVYSARGNYMRKLTDPSDSRNVEVMAYLNSWLSKSNNVHFWSHYWTDNMDSTITPYARTVIEGFSDLKALGIKGLICETRSPYWPSQRVFFYALARAAWDTSLNYDDILNDYCNEAYGPAASFMKSFHLLYEDKIYQHVPVLYRDNPAAQLFPQAFSSADLNTLESYLISAEAAVGLLSDVRVNVKAGKIGALTRAATGYNGEVTVATDSMGNIPGAYIMAMGDLYSGENNYALGVVKFALPTLPAGAVIDSAVFNSYGYFEAPYVKIQRYVNDNATDLGSSDHPANASLIDVAILQQFDSGGEGDNWTFFSYDLTAGVIADIAAGKTYSSYLLTPVLDAAGTPLNDGTPDINRFLIADYPVDFYDQRFPARLDINYSSANGSQANRDAITEVRGMFEKFKLLATDPATIPGIGPNLVSNPGAEISTGWLTDIYLGVGDYSFSISYSPHSGSRSFRIECTGNPGTARWYQTGIPVTIGKKYAARFWGRANGGAQGYLELYASLGPFDLYQYWVDSNDQWVQLVVPEFTAASSTIGVFLTSSGLGTVYYDDVFIAKLPE